jgi:hypothetical protein
VFLINKEDKTEQEIFDEIKNEAGNIAKHLKS